MKDRVAFRPWFQRLVLLAGYGVFLLLTYFMATDVEGFWLAVPAAIGIYCLYGFWKSLWLGVVVDARGIHHHSLSFRTELTEWSEIAQISCAQYETRFLLPIYGPIIHTKTTQSPLTSAGTYSSSTAQRRTDHLAALHFRFGGQPLPPPA